MAKYKLQYTGNEVDDLLEKAEKSVNVELELLFQLKISA